MCIRTDIQGQMFVYLITGVNKIGYSLLNEQNNTAYDIRNNKMSNFSWTEHFIILIKFSTYLLVFTGIKI